MQVLVQLPGSSHDPTLKHDDGTFTLVHHYCGTSGQPRKPQFTIKIHYRRWKLQAGALKVEVYSLLTILPSFILLHTSIPLYKSPQQPSLPIFDLVKYTFPLQYYT